MTVPCRHERVERSACDYRCSCCGEILFEADLALLLGLARAEAKQLREALESVVHWISDAVVPCCFPREKVLAALAQPAQPKEGPA